MEETLESHGKGSSHGDTGAQKLLYGLCDPESIGHCHDDPADI